MLLEILAIIVAFSAVMLLLSILVTSLAQATQAMLRLRARNLQAGLRALFEAVLNEPPDESRRLAASVLHSPEVSPLGASRDPMSLRSQLLGPPTSWIEPEVLAEAVAGERSTSAKGRQGNVSEVERDGAPLVEGFRRLDQPLRKRFATIMRAVSLVWAFVVAFAFQVSSPDLLAQLASDSEYRDLIANQATDVLAYSDDAQVRLLMPDATSTALAEFTARHPELAGELDHSLEPGPEPEAPVEDLADVLEGNENRAELVAEFEELLDRQLEETRDVALREARAASGRLAAVGFDLWQHGKEFYWEGGLQYRNLVGVLITAILLTLGAPFWFNMLRNSAGLRDLLVKRQDQTQSSDRATE